MNATTGEFALLRDGGQVLIRPYSATDRPAVEELFEHLSPQSRALRFHSAAMRISPSTIDAVTAGYAIVAELEGRLVGLASYSLLRDPTRAEMAIAIEDAQQGRGIGTVVFERLSRDARREGIQRLIADVMTYNRGMLGMLQGLGFHLSRTFEGGEVEVEVELRHDPTYVATADARMHVAASRSLEPIFRPRAVAVVGASRHPGTLGHEIFRNLLVGGFGGSVYPVNSAVTAVAGVRAYPNIAAIPEPVDLAVLVIPAAEVTAIAHECLTAGVRGLIVISAGFAEAGEEGQRLQDELLYLCRSHGARLIGPNSMGVLVNSQTGTMNATFAPNLPPAGKVAMSTQSGALGMAILDYARRMDIGISNFVAVGNKADVSSNDLIERWEDDPATEVILLYLESFGNPRRFGRIARRVGARKPIVAVKGGRAGIGVSAPTSRIAALDLTDAAVTALFRQSGITRCDTLGELFEVAHLLAHQPMPEGSRVGIVTNTHGLAVLCADACVANGLRVPTLMEHTQTALRSVLPPEAAVANPVEMRTLTTGANAAANYREAVRLLLQDPAIDAVIVVFVPPLVTDADDVAAGLVAACESGNRKPVLACFLGMHGTPGALRGPCDIPSYSFPEEAARALGRVAERAAWLRRPAGKVPTFDDIDAERARAVIDRALQHETHPWLGVDDVAAILKAYGIAMPQQFVVHSADEAADAWRALGGPAAIKIVSHEPFHRSNIGGVRLNIESAEAAAEAYRALEEVTSRQDAPTQRLDAALVQQMVSGVECLTAVMTVPIFGPLMAFGIGGLTAEVIGDVAHSVLPLTDIDAQELIESVKAAPLLHGYRGAPLTDIGALRELLLRLSQLVEDVPEISEIDINPVMVGTPGEGALVLDAYIGLSRES